MITFLFVHCIHSACSCIRLRCALFHTYADVVVGLLITSSMYICVGVAFVLSFLMLNDIKSFPFV